ncbi:hypothetical protein NY588_02565 [Curtobacterium flaccumfaciens pv. beticola]|uniref:hypothetical protein n=1 Tax=Curtobacterium flaccumfaciens TaxID=2035 RepID=UPI00349FAADE|nr:hypothetical protein [Curtobacterium flaccumfaciens pv. basellae]
MNDRSGGRPWWHVVSATLVGIGAAYLVHVGVVLLFLTGVGGLVALPVVTVLAGVGLGLCGFVGTGRRRAWWLGATALVLVPGALVTEVVPWVVASPGPLLLAPSPLPYLVGAVVGAVPALLVHPGRPRLAGLVSGGTAVLAVAALVTVLGVQAHGRAVERDQQAIARAQVAIGADFRPVTISPPGYGSDFEANIERRLPGFLQVFSSPASPAHYPGNTSGDDLTVVTLAADAPSCGRALEGVGPDGASEPETGCTPTDGVVVRTSAHGHEVAAVVGDTLVAVSALRAVDETVLRAAVRSAEPIGDAAYRHVLLGDGDEYTDELDGNRCPVTGAVCGP